MNIYLDEHFKNIVGKKVFFLGAGLSHSQLIVKYATNGAIVTLCDIRTIDKLSSYIEPFRDLDINYCLGEDYLSCLCDANIIFRTPGIDYTKKEIADAVEKGITVTSEIEMFFEYCPCPIIGITGSDGKTTTSSLIAAVLEKEGYTVWLGGNIGRPLFPLVEEIKENDIAVVELSSFQLISMKKSPHISLITNITPNHLDHHKDMKEYIDAKRNILLHQKENDIAVLNMDNDITRELAGDVKGLLRFFSRSEVENGSFIKDNVLYSSLDGAKHPVMILDSLIIRGEHNKENVAAAYAVVSSLVKDSTFIEVANSFPGVEHRIEFVRELNGVKWYNDSIATSPTRTIAGLRSFDRKIILIAGGSDKGLSYEPLAEDLKERVKCVFLSGPTGSAIAEVIKNNGSNTEIYFTVNVSESVKKAYSYSTNGDIVMLSPASPSFDSYSGFEARGKHFKQLVNELKP